MSEDIERLKSDSHMLSRIAAYVEDLKMSRRVMTDEQINQRIAEACGWTDIGECNCCFRLRGYPPEYSAHKKHIPNYCTDLNAIHEAEKMLSKAQWGDFVQHLANDWISVSDAWKDVCHATARQRAETFLRTLGKWEEA